jgi:DNA segregation ATPase FtsK/SpoIIIE-like protein
MGDRQHYSKRTLIGNWNESRLDTSKASRPEFERTGKHTTPPLKMPQFENQPDMYTSTQKSAFINPKDHKSHSQQRKPASYEQAQSLPVTITAHETSELHRSDAQPNPPLVLHGFGGILPRHDPHYNEQKREFTTTTHSQYGGAYDANKEYHLQQTQHLNSPEAKQQRAAEQEKAAQQKRDATIRSNTWMPDREMTQYAVGQKPIPRREEYKEEHQPHLPGQILSLMNAFVYYC